MNTAQKRRALLEAAFGSNDPQALELALIVELASRLLAERVGELADDDQSDELEVVA